MKAFVRILSAAVLVTAAAFGQISCTYSSGGPVAVPSSGTGGQAGGASNPANVATVIAGFHDAIVIDYVLVAVNLVHPRVGDLTMTLSHCGTSVTLFSGSSNPAASVNGIYGFTDYTVTPFASAVNAAQGSVFPGNYKPLASLSAFDGTNSAGPWILTVADLAAGVTGTVSLEITAISGGNYGNGILPVLSIPDGNSGSCVAPVTHVVNVPGSGQVGKMTLALDLHHSFASDLNVILSHGGVSATIMAFNAPFAPADLWAVYTFDDDAPTSWAQAITGVPNFSVVPTGSYRPVTPLSVFNGLDKAGPWFVTICDQGTYDTGTLNGAYLTIGLAAWNVQITQPNGSASATVTNSGGRMGDSYANLMTLVPGAYPYGWLHGVDMSVLEIAWEVSFGAPFYGQLSPCGSASTTLAGPIPSGLTVYVTSLELDPSGSIVNFKPAFAYVTP